MVTDYHEFVDFDYDAVLFRTEGNPIKKFLIKLKLRLPAETPRPNVFLTDVLVPNGELSQQSSFIAISLAHPKQGFSACNSQTLSCRQ